MLQHAGEEELACHCRLCSRGGDAHGGCHGRSRSRARRACKPGADAESTFETLNATWILQSEGAIWVSHVSHLMQHRCLEGLLPPLLPSSSFAPLNFFHKSTDPNYTTSTNVLSTVGTRRYEQ